MRTTLLQTSAACALALTVAMPATAQDFAIEEIVVTSRLRSESVQDIPLSITAFTVDQLRDQGIEDIKDLAEMTAGFAMDRGFGRFFDRPVIRGQASILGNQNASFFVDGVFVSNTISSTTIDSLERIEIVRGPQAALFGRATFAGAINYITKRPTDEHEGQFNGKYGSHEDTKASVWMSGPLIEDKLYYFAAANWDYYGGEWNNGLQPNTANNAYFNIPFIPAFTEAPTRGDSSKLGTEETQDFTIKLLAKPSENVELTFKMNYSDVDDSHYPRTLAGRDEHNCVNPISAGGTAPDTSAGYICGELEARDPNTGEARQPVLNIPDFVDGLTTSPLFFLPSFIPNGPVIIDPAKPGLQRETFRWLAQADIDLEGWSIMTRAAYNKDDENTAFDGDTIGERGISGTGLLQAAFFDDFRDYSLEMRVTSPDDSQIRGLAGITYYDEEHVSGNRGIGTSFGKIAGSFDNPSFVPSTGEPQFFPLTETVENWSVYAQVEFDITEDVTITAEGRYSEDTIGAITAATDTNEEVSFSSFAPRVSIDYRMNDDVLWYALISKGTKPGGFNAGLFDESAQTLATARANGTIAFNEERSWNYEAGVKTSFWDGRGTFNVSGYYIDWSNQTLTNIIDVIDAAGAPNSAPILVNLGSTEIKGGEVEANLAATEELTFGLGYGLAASKIKIFNDEQHFLLTGENDPTLANGGNVSGNQLPKSPKHTLNVNGTYRDSLSADADWFIRADLNVESKRFTQVSNLQHNGDSYKVNIRMGVEADNWQITGYVTNLLEDLTPNNILRFRDYRLASGSNFCGAAVCGSSSWRGFFFNQPRGRDFGVNVQYSF
ncbi:MAG: TonB-dependent receptor [Rhodospirillaceae bacterium]|nr:TonB-dependent receptor [Rhodospirillaceae bacterium]MBT5565632.1 TonB-dependent receptor [Rhodospirillaceae bacterium]